MNTRQYTPARKSLLWLVAIALVAVLAPSLEAQPLPVDALTLADRHQQPDGSEAEPLTLNEQRRLAKALKVMDLRTQWRLDSSDPQLMATLGQGRQRDVMEARIAYQLSDPWEVWHNPAFAVTDLDDVESTVLHAYGKMQRERLLNATGIQRWLDGKSERLDQKINRRGRSFTSSYKVDFSPQIDVGSHNRLGVMMRLPHTQTKLFDHLSLRMRHDFDDDLMSYTLKYDDNDKFFFLRYQPTTEESGDLWTANVSFWF